MSKTKPTTSVHRRRICFISTSDYALQNFLRDYVDQLAKGNEVVLVCNDDHGIPEPRDGVIYKQLQFRRNPSPFHDAIALIRLWWFLIRGRFDMVYTISPKGGLLGAVAAYFARIPLRVHFFTGQVWVTRTGLWRRLLKSFDQLIGRFCSQALIDSPSQKQFLIDENVVTAKKALVLGSGSVAGIDCQRFERSQTVRDSIRSDLGYCDDDIVLLYLGRLNQDKGVLDLARAFTILAPEFGNARLLMVGPDEGMQSQISQVLSDANVLDRVLFPGSTTEPEKFFCSGDVFCLPSYREGFGIVVLEAAAAKLPAVASNIYGLSDAVSNNETGLLHEPRNESDIANQIRKLIVDEDLRNRMGNAAAKRAKEEFSSESLLAAFMDFHENVVRTFLIKK